MFSDITSPSNVAMHAGPSRQDGTEDNVIPRDPFDRSSPPLADETSLGNISPIDLILKTKS